MNPVGHVGGLLSWSSSRLPDDLPATTSAFRQTLMRKPDFCVQHSSTRTEKNSSHQPCHISRCLNSVGRKGFMRAYTARVDKTDHTDQQLILDFCDDLKFLPVLPFLNSNDIFIKWTVSPARRFPGLCQESFISVARSYNLEITTLFLDGPQPVNRLFSVCRQNFVVKLFVFVI